MRALPVSMPFNSMNTIYQNILASSRSGQRMLALLIDPDKVTTNEINQLDSHLQNSEVTHILVGGSSDQNRRTDQVVSAIKKVISLPVILFPGDEKQLTNKADGLLFLSLISGRNPEYLIGQQIRSVGMLKKSKLEIIPTGYILLDGGKDSSVARVSNTRPIPQDELSLIVDTSIAGCYSGKKLIYLEAGSGAIQPVGSEIIKAVKNEINVPLLVGGGIRSGMQIEMAYQAGADMVVIGTAFEENENLFNELKNE